METETQVESERVVQNRKLVLSIGALREMIKSAQTDTVNNLTYPHGIPRQATMSFDVYTDSKYPDMVFSGKHYLATE
jgi:hypothetical protein